jgi:5-methylcytosine-specific restriction endonuclease McrA
MSYRDSRLVAIARDSRCLVCRSVEQLTTHHRIPRFVSRDDSPRNLVTLCRPCHDEVEQLDAIELYLSWANNLRG